MNCNNCHKNPCCCEKLISVRGKRGPKGDKGIVGPQGIPGQDGLTNVYIFTNPDNYSYIPEEPPVYEYTDSFTVVESGNYLILFEGCVAYDETETLIEYALFKNSVMITDSDRKSREVWVGGSEILTPIVTVCINSGVLSLSAGDIIQVGFKSDNNFVASKRSLTLIQVNNLTVL